MKDCNKCVAKNLKQIDNFIADIKRPLIESNQRSQEAIGECTAGLGSALSLGFNSSQLATINRIQDVIHSILEKRCGAANQNRRNKT